MATRTRALIEAVFYPDLPNDRQKRRGKLGLSRVALARILRVDPATVYRQEQQESTAPLWHSALRGIEAEAAERETRRKLRAHQGKLDDGHTRDAKHEECIRNRYTSEKMRAQKPRPRPKKAPAPIVQELQTETYEGAARAGRGMSRDAIKAIADRAEERSRRQG